MPVIARDPDSEKLAESRHRKFIPAPQGMHVARCVDVILMKDVVKEFPGKPARVVDEVKLVWQIAEHITAGKRFVISRKFTLSLHKKSALRAFMTAWRGCAFTDAELSGFDLERLLGAACLLQILHSPGREEGDVFARVLSATRMPKLMDELEPDAMYVRVQNRPGTVIGASVEAQAA
jgi:hypothetical protein